MKSLILRSAILAAATVLLSVSAFTQPMAMHFTVPFAFSNGERTLVAGEYVVRWDMLNSFAMLERKGGGSLYLPPGISSTTSKLEPRGKLVFHQYGNQYYLRSVVRPGAIKCDWPPSKAERETAKSLSPLEVALAVR